MGLAPAATGGPVGPARALRGGRQGRVGLQPWTLALGHEVGRRVGL